MPVKKKSDKLEQSKEEDMEAKTLAEGRGEKVKEPENVSISLGQIISVTDRPDGRKEILVVVEGDYKLNDVYKLVKE